MLGSIALLCLPNPALAVTVGSGLCASTVNSTAGITVSKSGGNCTINFAFTGAPTTWVIPAGVTSAQYTIKGAGTAGLNDYTGGRDAAFSGTGTISLTPASNIQIRVGGMGARASGYFGGDGGGYNGGGHAGENFAGGGGGATDLRLPPYGSANRFLVAGGSGGLGDRNLEPRYSNPHFGEDATGATGGQGASSTFCNGLAGANASSGGTGGASVCRGGGGGGGGYAGGGGAGNPTTGSNSSGGDGGRGSSYIDPAYGTSSTTSVWSAGNAGTNTDYSMYTHRKAAGSLVLTYTPPIVAPGAPTIGAATAGNAQALVSFTAPAFNGGAAITGYTATSTPGGLSASCASSPCTVAGLNNGTSYTFTVTATNSAGTGAASADSNSVVPRTVPEAPTIATATGGDAQALISFTAPAVNGGAAISGYTATSTPGNLSASCASSPCTVAGLNNGTSYTFTVTATNSAGTGNASAPSNEVTPQGDLDGDGVDDGIDAFPADPLESADGDADGIGDNGDAGGTGIGIRLLNAPLGCHFSRPVSANPVTADGAPGTPLDIELDFQIDGCGASVQVQALFGQAITEGSLAYKRGADGTWTEIPGAVIAGATITYTIADGGPLDADGLLNGSISDPVTALVPAAVRPQSVPVLPLWAMLTLALALGAAAVTALRRQGHYPG
ncbi:hypothetical protein GCM10027297_36500 [Parahaliea aestuarii]